jgi:hypothetical protein
MRGSTRQPNRPEHGRTSGDIGTAIPNRPEPHRSSPITTRNEGVPGSSPGVGSGNEPARAYATRTLNGLGLVFSGVFSDGQR